MFFRYVLGNLIARKASNAVAGLSIALVIGACVLALAFYHGLRLNLAATGRPDNLVVVQSGVLQTTKSLLLKETLDKVEVLPGVAEEGGQALVSRESHLDVELGDSGQLVPARGVDAVAFAVHDQVKITEGRAFEKGSNELIIGKKLVGKDPNWVLGGSINVDGERWPVVGIFSAGSSALEGEVWGDRSRLVIQLKRQKVLSAVVRAKSPQAVPELISGINAIRGSGALAGARAISEREYYENTIGNVSAVLATVASIIIVLVLGAIFAAANTLHASLSSRMGEFAALWVVGHRRGRLFMLILQEAFLLCFFAALVACLVTAPFGGREVTALLGGQLEFKLPFGLQEIGAAFALALGVGALGALFPGIQVLRRNLADDLG